MTKKKIKAVPLPIPDLATGYYRLTQDVRNPLADRRSRASHSTPAWKVGTVVKLKRHDVDGEISGYVSFFDNSSVNFSDSSNEPAFFHGNVMLPFLVPQERNLALMLRETFTPPATTILAYALEEGLITLDWIQALTYRQESIDPQEEEKMLAKHGL